MKFSEARKMMATKKVATHPSCDKCGRLTDELTLAPNGVGKWCGWCKKVRTLLDGLGEEVESYLKLMEE